jgi:phosphatidylethanolamine/phosphatidyl-N-methylethanolamine N-methyltransferase
MDDASPKPRPANPGNSDPIAFFLGFLRRPASVGSLVPSSRFLERRLVEAAALHSARMVV